MRKTEVALGLATVCLGLYIVLISLNIIPFADERFGAPRWIAALAGAAFVVGGGMVALIRGGVLGLSRRPRQAIWARRLRAGLTVVLLGIFAVIGNWLAFVPGEPRADWIVSLPFIRLSGSASQAVSRVAFGIGAVVLDGILVLAILDLLRRERSTALER